MLWGTGKMESTLQGRPMWLGVPPSGTGNGKAQLAQYLAERHACNHGRTGLLVVAGLGTKGLGPKARPLSCRTTLRLSPTWQNHSWSMLSTWHAIFGMNPKLRGHW